MYARRGKSILLVSLVFALSGSGRGAPPATEDKQPPEPGKPQRADRHGDPLPDGAIARAGTTRLRHAGGATAVAFSPDGKVLATLGGDSTLRLWEVPTGKPLRQFGEQGSASRQLEFTPDGKTVISASSDNTVRFWDVSTGKELRRIIGDMGLANAGLALSPDGKVLAVNAGNMALLIFDVETGRRLHRIEASCRDLSFSPDGRFVAGDYYGEVWDLHFARFPPT